MFWFPMPAGYKYYAKYRVINVLMVQSRPTQVTNIPFTDEKHIGAGNCFVHLRKIDKGNSAIYETYC